MAPRQARSIIIVDEQRAVTKSLQATLRELGYDAFAAANSSEEGLAEVAQRSPDLVLLDVRIRGKFDWQETARILKDKFDVPVVFLGKRLDKTLVERSMNGSTHHFVTKPFDLHELRTAIELALYQSDVNRQLRSQERWFASTLQSISDAVIDMDPSGNVTFMNPAAEQLTGVSLEASVGRPLRDIVRTRSNPDPNSSLQSLLSSLNASPQPNAPTASLPAEHEPRASAAPVFHQDDLLQPVMVLSDFNENHGDPNASNASERLASLATLTASVVHEISNPLAVVMANATVGYDDLSSVLAELDRGGPPSVACLAALRGLVEMQEETIVAAERITRILNDLKVFGHDEAHSKVSKVGRAINWALRTTGHELNQRARVRTQIGDVSDVRLDEKRLGQVLVNLLLNVRHALPKDEHPTKEVRISAHEDKAAKAVVIEVADTGTGMNPDVVARVFEPFFSTETASVGAGLGLPICRGIVSSVGGSISVESVVGLGTKVTLVLPAAEQSVSHATTPPPSMAHRHARILVVDDEPLVLRVIRRALKGHELVCVESARAALHLLGEGQNFDLILCDLVMPQMNGLELYRTLLHAQPAEAAKIVFLNGGVDNEALAVSLATIPNYKLSKPFKAEELRALVRRVVVDVPRAAVLADPAPSGLEVAT